MAISLCEGLTSGVWLEFRDARGHSLGQAVFADWAGRPLPAVGDTVVYRDGAGGLLRGRVVSRHFEVQKAWDGSPETWAYLVLQPPSARTAQASADTACREAGAACRQN